MSHPRTALLVLALGGLYLWFSNISYKMDEYLAWQEFSREHVCIKTEQYRTRDGVEERRWDCLDVGDQQIWRPL